MKLKDLLRFITYNTYVEVYSRDACLVDGLKCGLFKDEINDSLDNYIDRDVFMVSADGSCLQIVIT